MKKTTGAVLHAAAAAAMLAVLASCGAKKGTFKPGDYTAAEKGMNGDVTVTATFSQDRIEKITVESKETDSIGKVAMDKLTKQIIDRQSIAVDAVAGATISSNAFLKALEADIKKAGGNPDAFRTAAAKTGTDETIDTQVVVVGGGAAGTAAALQAVQNGAKVVLVEMTPAPAGQATMAGGLFANNSTQQKQKKQVVSDEWLYNQFAETANYTTNGSLLSKIIRQSGSTVDWLIENGCRLILVHAGTGGYVEHHYSQPADTLHGYIDGGAKGIAALHETITKNGGKVLYSTKAESLIIKDNKICGITATKEDGGTLSINAKAVVLATGGFGGNKDKVAEVFGEGFGTSRVGTNIGTGIEMAQSVNADADFHNAILMHYGVGRGAGWGSILNYALMNPWLMVDVDGNRFVNEESVVFEPIKTADAVRAQPLHTAYELFDQTLIDIVKQKGAAGITDLYPGVLTSDPTKYIEVGHPVDSSKSAEKTRTPADVTADIEKLVSEGKLIKAASVAELAQKLGMTNLQATVERYNQLCENGKDTDLFKSAKYLDKLEGTVYAAKLTPSPFLGTLGGIRINDKCEVLDKNGKAVAGLYAAGAETSGVYGNSYIFFEGGTLGYAYGSGRIAGDSAAAFVK